MGISSEIERKYALAEQLREEIAAKDAEILELKRCKDSAALERDTLRGELASTQANARAREISEEVELKMARSLAHARLEARRTIEEMHAKGFDLSAEVEEVKALKEESAAPASSDEGSGSGIGDFSELQEKTGTLERLRDEVNQLRNARAGDSFQTSRIAKLEIYELKLKAEVVDARAEAEEVRSKADKKVAIHLKYVAEAHTKLRGASDRERRSNKYVRCKSWRETLEEIHGKGFDLSEEIEQGKVDEFDAKLLVSYDESDE
ncbi:uncharacterized protein [Nicotiana sylvestris]|uniref:uncharacterized protein n=1 Tax=Nicotiana sylvestris TaxID=4096 RepID=UPI00388CA8A7